jgi:DNA repair exonuclease SbcCD ATPase subunit
MKYWIGGLLKAYAVIAAYALALIAVVVAILFASGALTGERVRDAARALRGPGGRPSVPPSARPDDLEKIRGDRQKTLDLREMDLQKLETRLAGEWAQVRTEREELEGERRKIAGERGQLQKEQEAFAAAKSDAELAANLPILSRMDGAAIVSFMKSWDDARFVRYLRAMRASKAAEALEAVRSDPQFEQEFRRVPEDSAPGAKTRAERLAEEFRKAP